MREWAEGRGADEEVEAWLARDREEEDGGSRARWLVFDFEEVSRLCV
jgi:hypothetical protein